MLKELPIITCPICGTEYLPSEIFLPNDVFGKQYDITKDDNGKIKFYLGDDPNLDEEFICECCNTKLNITMKMSFDIKEFEDDFDEEYSVEINKPKKIKLEETNLF